MSTELPVREGPSPRTLPAERPSETSKAPRILSCILCQQRKVKCDRQYPCSNCIKARVQCVQASVNPRRRKRRFPERILLDRLRHYEDLLRQNDIQFEPLHRSASADNDLPNAEGGGESDEERSKRPSADSSSPSTNIGTARSYESKNTHLIVNQEYSRPRSNSSSSGNEGEVIVRNAWSQIFNNNDHLLFGFRGTEGSTAALHPEPVQILRLWQIYLENVEPLLKVVHAPTLQSSIMQAAGDVSNISPALEALMFGIYCMATFSLTIDDCQNTFGTHKADLLNSFWLGCQQALVKCGFLRTSDRECLTAFYLYLVSLRHSTVPQSLSSMLGVALRIAQRMGIHSELALSKCNALEAEMRRRLWWSLVLFDSRIGELADAKSPSLTPTWDCRIPMDVNDSDLRAKMTYPSPTEGRCSEALFSVVRGALGNWVRHTMFNLFASPSSKSVAKDLQQTPIPQPSELDELEHLLEDKYLKYCDPEDSLHFMTIWTSRATLAKCRILEHNFRYSSASMKSEALRKLAMSYAIDMLDCDTQLMSSPLTEKFRWLVHFFFPMFAYIQLAQILKNHAITEHSQRAWKAMSDNYEARFGTLRREDIPFVLPFFKAFAELLLLAWDARKATAQASNESVQTPDIVTSIKEKLEQIAPHVKTLEAERVAYPPASAPFEIPPTPLEFGGHALKRSEAQPSGSYHNVDAPGEHAEVFGLGQFDFNVESFDWTAMDWTMVNIPGANAGDLGDAQYMF